MPLVDLDLDLGDVLLELDVVLFHPGDGAEDLVDGRCLTAEHAEVGSVDPDRDRLARAGEHLPDPLLEVRQHVAERRAWSACRSIT